MSKTPHYSPYSILIGAYMASEMATILARLGNLLEERDARIAELTANFVGSPPTPELLRWYEEQLQELLQESGRQIMELVCNGFEPEFAEHAPHFLKFEAGGYRRMNEKTANRHVDTTFGRITLWRRGYRYRHRDDKEPTIFPLELILGLLHGTTPALAGEVARRMAETGATQNRVLQDLKRQFSVSMSVKRLRAVTEAVSELVETYRAEYQVRKLLKLLKEAKESKGRYKPIFAVGRDGIYIPIAGGDKYQQAATATITIYDRSGTRLGSVYLAAAPESGQPALTEQLTELIKQCLHKWCKEHGNPLPRLCYVTDAGDNECNYYSRVLCYLRDPRRPHRRLYWHRIIDYFHATERITIMSEAIFGPGQEASSWARRMRKLLLKPGGPSRVLHSAAAMRSIYGVQPKRSEDFEQAYNYIRNRTQHMDYARFKALKLPIGSGVTEAACKTVVTQRLKLSGMGWECEGAQVILNLRVTLLSGIWDEVYTAVVESRTPFDLKAYTYDTCNPEKTAA